MALPADWWTKDMADEPCDTCGTKPSKHEGHGAYVCKTCYEARWCPKCTFSLYPEPHTCLSPAERKRREQEAEKVLAGLGIATLKPEDLRSISEIYERNDGMVCKIIEVAKLGKKKIRITVRADCIPGASYARVELFTGAKWEPLHSIPEANMRSACIEIPVFDRSGTKGRRATAMDHDRRELIRVACEILDGEP